MDFGIIIGILGGLAFILGFLMLILVGISLVLIFVGLITVAVFLKTRKVLLPKITLFILNVLEGPISYIVGLFVNGDVVSKMMVDIRNDLLDEKFRSVSYNERFLFLPHCLRSNDCPAKSTHDGLKCIECGKCSIAEIKREAEKIGYNVFIVPGSSLLKIIVKKYRPKAVLGVGCVMEVKEGVEKMSSYGIPVQGFLLDRDGCMDTKVNVRRLIERLKK